MTRPALLALAMLTFCGCEALNLPDPRMPEQTTEVYPNTLPPLVPDALPGPQDAATGTPGREGDVEPQDDGSPLWALRHALGLE